uniref:RING-type domain-containing protein n=1 Tax=viral metagenome TaxID=1070528 RepID=A0A6C0I7P4_9ZZZZ
MDNHIITFLQTFEKPETEFLKDKECLICLDPFDIEANQHVMLPCKCSNSAYHIDCIIKLLHSGENKNFCPHCKTKYEAPFQPQMQVAIYQVAPYIAIPIGIGIEQSNQRQIHDLHMNNFTAILMIHILSNSFMNIINLVVSRISLDYNNDQALQVLMLFYFGKLFFNYCILMYSKSNIDKIEGCLCYSYVFQTVLFCFLIYALTKIKNDDYSALLIANNILFGFGDAMYRVIIENRINNTVNILH